MLIDCGLFQGAETSANNPKHDALAIDFPIGHIKALVITHVHIDHAGRIPSLLAAGFRGPIYCSEPSAVLLPLVLEDAVRVGFTRNRRLIERVIKAVKRQITALPYQAWRSVQLDGGQKDSLLIRFSPAGHILGSAYVTCRVQENSGRQRVIFSGDLGAPWALLLSAPKSPWGCDRLVIESTYGNRTHAGRRERRERLRQVLGKSLLLPALRRSIGN